MPLCIPPAANKSSGCSAPLLPAPFFFFSFFRAAPVAHGSSQDRGQMKAAASGLHHSLSSEGTKPYLLPTP